MYLPDIDSLLFDYSVVLDPIVQQFIGYQYNGTFYNEQSVRTTVVTPE